MSLLIAYGTRPEYIKIKPLISELEKSGIKHEVLFTGQQEDIAEGEFHKRISIEKSAKNRLDAIVSSCMNDDWIFHGATHVIVQGDTSSALGVALAAFHRKIKVIHLEAGLRTYQKNPYPEEMNRRLIDTLSDLHLCPTPENASNLYREGFGKSVVVTGNTGLDNLRGISPSYNDVVMVTMHRRENHENMHEWFRVINLLAQHNSDLIFTIPIHPNPNVVKHAKLLSYMRVLNPMPYDQMIKAVSECKFLITDSGGLQEEAAFFNKKAIVCRDCTERPEVLGIHSFLCAEPDELPEIFDKVVRNYIPSKHFCPYGDGMASGRVVEVIKSLK